MKKVVKKKVAKNSVDTENVTTDDNGKTDNSINSGNMTPNTPLKSSGRKELGELKGVSGKNNPQTGARSSKMSEHSVISGGDVDVNSFIKNMKQIETEKEHERKKTKKKIIKKPKAK